MFADFCARVARKERKLATGRKRRQRKYESDADYAFRLAHADLDRYLAHCEVAGWVLRRYATSADLVWLEFPAEPGSLTVGYADTFRADVLRADPTLVFVLATATAATIAA